jgi:flagellar hook-associated protein 1 FlgK
MGLSSAINASVTGLQLTQDSLGIIANNIANADSPGFTRKIAAPEAILAGEKTNGARLGQTQRALDEIIQKQTRTEVSVAAELNTIAGTQMRLDALYGTPGTAAAFDTLYNDFTSALQTLSSNPDSSSAQADVVNKAQVFSQTLNRFTNDIQTFRQEAENGIAASVNRANTALQSLESINTKIASFGNGKVPPDLLDARDQAIDSLAEEIDIRVLDGPNGQVSVFSTSGIQLFNSKASRLGFDANNNISARSLYSDNPAERGVGTITVTVEGGTPIDLLAGGHLRSGKMAGFVQLRDDVLVQQQARLDTLASSMALALSNRTETGTVLGAPVMGSDGHEVDLTGLQLGNQLTVNYQDLVSGEARTIRLIHVTDASQLPLANTLTPDPNDVVIGADLTDPTDVTARLAAAGINLSAAAGAGNILQILDDGAGATTDVNSLEASITVTTTTGGPVELAFFIDGIGPASFYTGSLNGGAQELGFAGRITVNQSLIADPSELTRYTSGIAAADDTRPNFLLRSLAEDRQSFSPAGGIGSRTSPFNGSINEFAQEIVNQTGAEAAGAKQAQEAQEIVLNSLLARQADITVVDIDEELALLTQLQNNYAANARVLQAVQELLDRLISI